MRGRIFTRSHPNRNNPFFWALVDLLSWVTLCATAYFLWSTFLFFVMCMCILISCICSHWYSFHYVRMLYMNSPLFPFAAVIPLVILVLNKAVNLSRHIISLAKSTSRPYIITPILETEVLSFWPLLFWNSVWPLSM